MVKKYFPSFAVIMLACLFSGTTYVIMEGDLEVGRYEESDGQSGTRIIRDGKVVTAQEEAARAEAEALEAQGDEVKGVPAPVVDDQTILVQGDEIVGGVDTVVDDQTIVVHGSEILGGVDTTMDDQTIVIQGSEILGVVDTGLDDQTIVIEGDQVSGVEGYIPPPGTRPEQPEGVALLEGAGETTPLPDSVEGIPEEPVSEGLQETPIREEILPVVVGVQEKVQEVVSVSQPVKRESVPKVVPALGPTKTEDVETKPLAEKKPFWEGLRQKWDEFQKSRQKGSSKSPSPSHSQVL